MGLVEEAAVGGGWNNLPGSRAVRHGNWMILDYKLHMGSVETRVPYQDGK